MKAPILIRYSACCAALAVAGSAHALVTYIDVFETPDQDVLQIQQVVHELGTDPTFFAPDELIDAFTLFADAPTACFDGNDDPFAPNYLVAITNLSPIAWQNLHYVADPWTSISNYDGGISDASGSGLPGLAFRIDDIGINQPLVSESMSADLIFEPGETWEFILQDYSDLLPVPLPAALGSPGVAEASSTYLGGDPNFSSTGSIIAVTAIPEPLSAGVGLGILLAGLMTRQRWGSR